MDYYFTLASLSPLGLDSFAGLAGLEGGDFSDDYLDELTDAGLIENPNNATLTKKGELFARCLSTRKETANRADLLENAIFDFNENDTPEALRALEEELSLYRLSLTVTKSADRALSFFLASSSN